MADVIITGASRGIGRALLGGRLCGGRLGGWRESMVGDRGVGGLLDSGPIGDGICPGPGLSSLNDEPSPLIIGGGVSSISSGGGRAIGSTMSAAPGFCRPAIDSPLFGGSTDAGSASGTEIGFCDEGGAGSTAPVRG